MKIPDDIERYVRKRRFLRIGIWAICMGLFSFAFFSSWDSISKSVYTEIRVAIFIGVLVVSVFIFGIPKLFYEKSFVGKIVSINVVTKADSNMRMGFIEALYRRVWVYAIIELANGKKIHKEIASKRTQRLNIPSKILYRDDGSFLAKQYGIGDTVIFVSGTKYCQVYSEDKENLTCVVCGEFNSFNNTSCEHCGHTIVKG